MNAVLMPSSVRCEWRGPRISGNTAAPWRPFQGAHWFWRERDLLRRTLWLQSCVKNLEGEEGTKMIAAISEKKTVLMVLILLTSGCINITTRLEPEDTSINEVLQGSDCVSMILGFGFGTATIDRARADARQFGEPTVGLGHQQGHSSQTITRVRRVQATDRQYMLFGSKCVEVVGE